MRAEWKSINVAFTLGICICSVCAWFSISVTEISTSLSYTERQNCPQLQFNKRGVHWSLERTHWKPLLMIIPHKHGHLFYSLVSYVKNDYLTAVRMGQVIKQLWNPTKVSFSLMLCVLQLTEGPSWPKNSFYWASMLYSVGNNGVH